MASERRDVVLDPRVTQNDISKMEIVGRIHHVRRNPGKSRQYSATVMANISIFTVGAMIGMAVYLHIDVWKKPVNPEYIWVMLVTFVAIILGLLYSYFLSERYGRKLTLCSSAIPLTLSCGLIAFIDNYASTLIAFFLGGFGGSMCSFILPIYVCEISCDRMRGRLGGIRMISMNIGFTIAYVISNHRDPREAAFIIMFFPLIFAIGFIWMPESPVYLVRKSRADDAIKSLLWLRGNDEQFAYNDFSRIKDTDDAMKNGGCIHENGLGTIKDLFRNQAKRRGFVIASGILIAQSLWEVTTLSHVRERIYTRPSWIPIIDLPQSFSFQILGSSAATMMMDCLGRKLLLLFSCVGTSLYFEARIGISIAKANGMDISTIETISIASYFLGMGTVSSIVAVEVFPREAASLGYMMALGISWIVVPLFLMMTRNISSISPLFNIALCICSFLFSYYLLPKTEGRSIESISAGLSSGFGR